MIMALEAFGQHVQLDGTGVKAFTRPSITALVTDFSNTNKIYGFYIPNENVSNCTIFHEPGLPTLVNMNKGASIVLSDEVISRCQQTTGIQICQVL